MGQHSNAILRLNTLELLNESAYERPLKIAQKRLMPHTRNFAHRKLIIQRTIRSTCKWYRQTRFPNNYDLQSVVQNTLQCEILYQAAGCIS